MSKSKNVASMDDEFRNIVRRYWLLKKRRDKIESEMSEIKSAMLDLLDSMEVDGVEDRNWKVLRVSQTRTTVDKRKFVNVYGESALGTVCSTSHSTRVDVRKK